MFKAFVARLVGTLVALTGYGMLNTATDSIGSLVAGKVAANQFDASDSSFVITNIIFNSLHTFHFGVAFWLLIVALIIIWAPWKIVKACKSKMKN